MKSDLDVKGTIFLKIENKDGTSEEKVIPNTVLKAGKVAIAKGLCNILEGGTFDFFVVRMLFGDNGVDGSNTKKFVDTNRQSLFGLTRLSKPVISSINPASPTQAIFTSVVTFDEVVSISLSEMALQMNTGDLFSMSTFSPISKTNTMQLVFNWTIGIM